MSQVVVCSPVCKRTSTRNRGFARPKNLAPTHSPVLSRIPTVDKATPHRQEFAHCSEGGRATQGSAELTAPALPMWQRLSDSTRRA